MANTPLVLVIGTIKMLAQAGMTEKIVDVCNEWLDEFVSSPTQDAADSCKACGQPLVGGICANKSCAKFVPLI